MHVDPACLNACVSLGPSSEHLSIIMQHLMQHLMQLGMLAQSCYRVSGHPEATSHIHTRSTAALRSAFWNTLLPNESADTCAVASQWIWSIAGSSEISFLFWGLPWLVLFAVAIPPRDTATIGSRQDLGPSSLHRSMVQHPCDLAELSGRRAPNQRDIPSTYGSRHVLRCKMC